MAGQTQTLLQSLVARGSCRGTARTGRSATSTALYIGRGVPDAWIAPGQTISVDNLTASYDEHTGRRATYGVRISTGGGSAEPGRPGHADRRRLPGGDVQVQLPVFASAGVRA